MAKRGETRPWRVRFEWENGVKGVNTHRTEGDALREAAALQARSDNGSAPSELVLVQVAHRDSA